MIPTYETHLRSFTSKEEHSCIDLCHFICSAMGIYISLKSCQYEKHLLMS